MTKLFVKPRPDAGHVEVEVEIIWDDLSLEDMKFLAQQCILKNLQAKIQAGFYDGIGIPEVITLRAEWEVHHPEDVGELKFPESWKTGTDKPAKKPKAEKPMDLEAMLRTLSPEELRALLK